ARRLPLRRTEGRRARKRRAGPARPALPAASAWPTRPRETRSRRLYGGSENPGARSGVVQEMQIADADGTRSGTQRGGRRAELGRHAIGRHTQLDERLDVARLERRPD